MILGFSHLTLRCASLDAAIPELEKLGYLLDFRETVANPVGKKRLLSRWCEKMEIALLRAESALPVELVDYPWEWSDGPAFFEPILGSVGAGPVAPPARGGDQALAKFIANCFGGGSLPARIHHPHFRIDAWSVPAERAGIIGLVERVPSLDGALEFWSRLGGRVERRAEGGLRCARVTLLPPVRAWALDLMVVEDASIPERGGTMDGPGITCLSFLSSDVDRDSAAQNPGGAMPSSGIFDIVINKKPLRLEILHALPGFFAEWLDAKAARSGTK